MAVKDLSSPELDSIRNLIPPKFYDEACRLRTSHYQQPDREDLTLYLASNSLVQLNTLTSKQIRQARHKPDPICIYKFGPILTPSEVINWGSRIKKLTSTRQKNTLLRVAHGEIYSRERLHRFRLTESPNCPNCDLIETTQHKIYDCAYTQRIWAETFKHTNKFLVDPNSNQDISQKVIGACEYSDIIALAIHSEILQRIRHSSTFLLRPKTLVTNAIRYLRSKEKSIKVKNKLDALLSEQD